MGKSTLQFHLLQLMKNRFDLCVSFTGSSSCSPEMRQLVESRWDPRFLFPTWNQEFMEALLAQQERLKLKGQTRHVIILVDDIVLTGKDEESLAHLALRGRHFNISLMMCAVSYTTLPKRCRRSLDCLCLFSLPMAGDAKLLCQEYASKTNMALYCLQNLEEHQCLVMETLQRKQRLYFYRVDLTGADQTEGSQAPSESETKDAPGKLDPSQNTHRLECTGDAADQNEDQESVSSDSSA